LKQGRNSQLFFSRVSFSSTDLLVFSANQKRKEMLETSFEIIVEFDLT
jgi:hypothetical protein